MVETESKFEFKSLGVGSLGEINRIHAASFPDGIWTKLGASVVERFYLWHLTGPHPVADIIGAFAGSECVGFILTGVFNGSTTGFIRNNRMLLLRKIIVRPWLISDDVFMQKLKPGFKLFKKTFRAANDNARNEKRKSYGFLSMGVLPEYQNRGIGTALMQEAEKRAVGYGYKLAHFTVDTANVKAIHIYERLGWRKVFENEVWKGFMNKEIVR